MANRVRKLNKKNTDTFTITLFACRCCKKLTGGEIWVDGSKGFVAGQTVKITVEPVELKS